jgi:hypothetical protein
MDGGLLLVSGLNGTGNEVRMKKLSLDLLMAWSERISYLNINRWS